MQKHTSTKYIKPQTTVVRADACSLMSGSVDWVLKSNGNGNASEAMSNSQNNLWDDSWDEKTGNWLK